MIDANAVREAIRAVPPPERIDEDVRRMLARHPGIAMLLDLELQRAEPGSGRRFEALALAVIGAFERAGRLPSLDDGLVAAAALSVERDVAHARSDGDLSRFAADFAAQMELFAGVSALHRALFAHAPATETAGRAFWFFHALARACLTAGPAPLLA